MDKQALNKYVALIIVAIGRSGRPNSHVWMDVDPQMQDLDTYNTILGGLQAQDILVNRGHFLTLTDKGLSILTKIENLYLK